MDVKDFIEDLLQEEPIFERKEALNPDYIPANLPAREKQIKELAIIFRDILTKPGSVSVTAITVGKHGTGKTVTVRKFGELVTEIGKERGIKIMFAHVNCHKQRTVFLTLVEAARQLNIDVPNRGLSTQELFKNLHDHLEKRKAFLIIALDEFDYLINTSTMEDLYLLARVYDEPGFTTKRINYIFIIRDLNSLMIVDRSIRDQFMKNVVVFPEYTKEELYQILKDRVENEKAIRKGAIEEEALRYIAEHSENARFALEVLDLAGVIAQTDGAPIITVEYAKKAISQINPELGIISKTIKDLDLHQLLLLKAILKNGGKQVSIGTIENEYVNIVRNLGEKPRKHSQVYEYIRKMKMLGLVITEQSGKGTRGRTTLVSVTDSVKEIEENIEKEIQNRLKEKTE